VNQVEACDQTPKDEGIIEFGEDTDTGLCPNGSRIYKWHVNVSDGYDVNVTISSLHLNENYGNYLIISPGKWKWSICYNTMLAQWHSACQTKPVFGNSQYIICLCIIILG